MCDLTDEDLLTEGLAECPLAVGDHFIEIMVHDGDADGLPTVCQRSLGPERRRPRELHTGGHEI